MNDVIGLFLGVGTIMCIVGCAILEVCYCRRQSTDYDFVDAVDDNSGGGEARYMSV